ncbi:MAG: pilin [Sulfuricella sp.]
MDGLKSNVAEFYGSKGYFPPSIGANQSVEGTTAGKYGAITIGSGGGGAGPLVLNYTLNSGRAKNEVVSLSTTDGSAWDCGATGGAKATTTVPAKWLPSGCK